MKIGFKKVDEEEQKWIKMSRKMDVIVYTLIMGIVWIGIVVSIAIALYYGGRILIFKENKEDLLRYASRAGMLLLIPLSVWLVRKLIEYFQMKNIVLSPYYVNSRYRKVESFSLRDILYLMQIKPMQWFWDIVFLLFLGVMLAIIISGGSTDIVISCMGCLILAILLLMGHFLFWRYYLGLPHEKTLIRNSEEYFAINNSEQFCQWIDQSIRTRLCFCSKQFCFTKDLFLGYTEADSFYHPAVVQMEDIEAMEFYMILANCGVMINKGILACKLKNGNVVDFYIGTGKILEITLNSMDYYCINYQYNKQPVLTNFGRR